MSKELFPVRSARLPPWTLETATARLRPALPPEKHQKGAKRTTLAQSCYFLPPTPCPLPRPTSSTRLATHVHCNMRTLQSPPFCVCATTQPKSPGTVPWRSWPVREKRGVVLLCCRAHSGGMKKQACAESRRSSGVDVNDSSYPAASQRHRARSEGSRSTGPSMLKEHARRQHKAAFKQLPLPRST